MKKLLIALLVPLTSTHAFAIDGNNTWRSVDVSYASMNADESDDFEPSGFKLQGKYLLDNNFFFAGRYQNLSEDLASDLPIALDATIEEMRLGAGYRFELSNQFDLYTLASYYNQTTTMEVEDISLEFDASGMAYTFGGTFAITPDLEIFVELSALELEADVSDLETEFDVEDTESAGDMSFSETEYAIGASYLVNNNFALSMSYSTIDEADVFSFGGAYYF